MHSDVLRKNVSGVGVGLRSRQDSSDSQRGRVVELRAVRFTGVCEMYIIKLP